MCERASQNVQVILLRALSYPKVYRFRFKTVCKISKTVILIHESSSVSLNLSKTMVQGPCIFIGAVGHLLA